MHLTDDELRTIAAQAEPIFARIQNGHYTSDITKEALEIERKIQNIYSENSNLSYEKRFQLQIPDNREIREYLSLERLDDDEPLPEWAQVINRLVAGFETRYTNQDELSKEIISIPFGTLLYPVADLLADRARLDDLLSPRLFSNRIRAQIESAFISRISWFMAQALHLEFRIFKQKELGGDIISDPNSTKIFGQFRDYQVKKGFKKTLVQYPVAARYLGLTVLHWSSILADLLTQIKKDSSDLYLEFDIPFEQNISDILISKGDYHNREQTVSHIKFESGDSIYYKPKDLQPDLVLNRLCKYISDQSDFAYDLSEVEILTKDGYGYVKELIPQSITGSNMECQAALQRYYRRVGYLLCLVYITNTTDIHYENILAIKERPCIIDCETMFTQDITTKHIRTGCSQQRIMATKIAGSVLRTALLPFVLNEQSQRSYGRSGIAQTEPFETEAKTVDWKHTNTDAMEYVADYAEVYPETNTPRVNGDLVPPDKYIEEIIAGFGAVYEKFKRLETPIETLFPDTNLNDIESRYLFRDTSKYSAVLQSLIAPNRLHSGGQIFLVTELLLKDTDKLSLNGIKKLFPILLSEQKSINRLNIPKFGNTGTDLAFEDNVVLPTAFKNNEQLLRDNISSLSNSDKHKQIKLIKATLQSDL